ncbi:MAG: DUF4386 domain-containing protein [Candidatus Hodarchaeales archaeon]
MNQELSLSRRVCARNAGFAITARLLIALFVFLSLNTIFEVPGEATLTAAQSTKNNGLLFFIVILAILIMSFLTLMAAMALNNVLMSVNKDLSIVAAALRLIEGLFFIISMILLFIDVSAFSLVFLFGQILYAFYLVLVGYLVFKAGYLNRPLGISLVIGGSVGYLVGGLTHLFLPSFEWLFTIGIIVAVLAEFALGILLVVKAVKMTMGRPDPKRTITLLLAEVGEATTAELIDEVSRVSRECKDRVPRTLIALEEENKITKRISKEEKAIVWTLAS